MATSNYFNLYGSRPDQKIIEDLIVESIKIMGFDSYYLPNDNDAARDLLYGEDPTKKFNTAFPLEMYLSNATEYGGDKEMFTKFGLEIRNQVSVIVSKRTFSQRVPQNTFQRPREGDLIYVPFLNGLGELYEIKFVNQTKDFFQLGRKLPYFYELDLEKFKYSQEVISTGIPDIDVVVYDSG
jgi:Virus neck protein